MPRGNGTGPMGQGPMTGRRAGYCAGGQQAGFMSSRGGGSGGGFSGGGRGRRNRVLESGLTYMQQQAAASPMSEADELAVLRKQAADFEEAIINMRARIQTLETKGEAAK